MTTEGCFDSNTGWMRYLDERLTLNHRAGPRPKVLDLFAGCGGLALGFEAAGFDTMGYEIAADACETYNANLTGKCVHDELIVGYDYALQPDVIIGGPPCQPFSVGGDQRGPRDERDGFPAFLDAVDRLRPRLALIENVRGLLYRNRDYLDAVVSALKRLGYNVDCRLLKAAEYGVPQNRERVFIIASKGGWKWPGKTATTPVTAGVALGELAEAVPADARYLTEAQDRYIAVYEKKSKCVRPRDLHLDRPARTVTCRNLGASTSDMQRIRLPDGRRRMLTNREGARLQSFPDWFEFLGRESSVAKQIGNAVPPLMSYELALSVMECVGGDTSSMRTPAVGQLELVI